MGSERLLISINNLVFCETSCPQRSITVPVFRSHKILSPGLCIERPVKEFDTKLMPNNLMTEVKNHSFLKLLHLD